jgi:TRAP-type mannitol/chloroaromatic compound transport system permease small subunit
MKIETLCKALDQVSEWSGRIFLWFIIPLTALVVFEVISRRIFGAPHIWAPEITNALYGPHFMMVAAYTLLYKGHVNIDIIYLRFSPRVRGVLDCFTYLIFFFPFCSIMLHQGIVFAYTSWMQHETTGSAALPIVPEIKTVIPLTFALLLIQGLANFIRSLILVIRGRTP